jgi:hypothetical protein
MLEQRYGFCGATTPVHRPLTCLFRKGTIGELSDKVLLNIFCYFLDVSPRHWPTLVHICRKWRGVVFASQQDLRLRLVCTHGVHVSKTLECWPALPIVVQYGGFPKLEPPSPEDDDSIIAALKLSSRICSISLTVTGPLLEKLTVVSEPFSNLEEIALLSQDTAQLTLPSTFQWGPRLRRLYLTRIAFPSNPWPLISSRVLVDIRLHGIFSHIHMPLESLVFVPVRDDPASNSLTPISSLLRSRSN